MNNNNLLLIGAGGDIGSAALKILLNKAGMLQQQPGDTRSFRPTLY